MSAFEYTPIAPEIVSYRRGDPFFCAEEDVELELFWFARPY